MISMRQIEITVRLDEKIENAVEKLIKKGYKLIRESDICDIYMTNKYNKLSSDNIQDILKKSVLLRSLKLENKEIKKITYKNKEYDENGNVVSEKKINLNCDDLEKAYELFLHLDFEKLVEVKYHVSVYEKNGIEFAFQNVENLGYLIEYENVEDFENEPLSKINSEKQKMFEFMKSEGLILTDELDVKKAKELILKEKFKK